LICCAAKPEVEAWLVAGFREQLNLRWSEVASHARFKEEVFDPFLRNHGNPRSPGEGREHLMRTGLSNYQGLLAVCPELAELEARLRNYLKGKE
jgi:hypothetical protein